MSEELALPEGDQPTHQWVMDGHLVHFNWVLDEIRVSHITCPHEGTNSYCNRRRNYCLVRRFFEVYGPEMNSGEIPINGPVEIAWAPQLGESDLDAEYAGLWVMPVDDPNFRAVRTALEG